MTPVSSITYTATCRQENCTSHPVDLRIVDLAKTAIPDDRPHCDYLDVSLINRAWKDVTLEATGRIIFETAVDTAYSLTIRAKKGVDLKETTVGGDLTVTSGAEIWGGDRLAVTGVARFESTADDRDITLLGHLNSFRNDINVKCGGTATVMNWGNTWIRAEVGQHLTLDVSGPLCFSGISRVGGNLLAMCNNNISQANPLYVSGQSRFVTDVSDRWIRLMNLGNVLMGEIRFLTQSTGCNWANVSLANRASLTDIEQSDIRGDFMIEAGSAVKINQTHVAGDLTVIASQMNWGTHNQIEGETTITERV